MPLTTTSAQRGGEHRPKHARTFPIVGVGASAGGFEAFTRLLSNLPADTGMAFVLVQHLDPAHESMLTELLSRKTTLPVKEAREGMKVEPNHVYVIPRDASMTISSGILKVTSRQEDSGKHLPVDRFLNSLAEDQKSRAIGIILSGTGSDGALGIREVKAEGGLIFAQDEASAKFPGMPQSAAATGCVDFILSPEKIAQELSVLRRHPYVSLVEPSTEIEVVPEEKNGLTEIFRMLRTATNVDFSYYKPATIMRRILRRLAVHRMEHVEEYSRYLQGHPEEIYQLYEDLLISVTGFFRDPEAFQSLKATAFPRLMKDREPNSVIRVWVPGCSSGEEAYSIAICLLESLAEVGRDFDIQIFGTDISDLAIEKARAGVYPENIRQHVSADRLERFFVKNRNDGYQVSKRVREMCVFAKQNLVKDPPFSKLDLISCRNLLIYLGPLLQEKALAVLNYALKPGGFLFLGKSESLGTHETYFELEGKRQKLYFKKLMSAAPVLDDVRGTLANEGLPAQVQNEASRLPEKRYPPTGDSTPGKAGFPVLQMARGLAQPLASAIERAKQLGSPVSKQGVHLQFAGKLRDFGLEVIPITSGQVGERFWFVLFQELASPLKVESKKELSPKAGKDAARKQSQREINLETELSGTQEHMQSIVEEYDATNEELQAANEEIQSSNEELQSTNEELQTSKEELEASNEELVTVNEELQNRNVELLHARDDLTNLFANVDLPIVMVGNDLCIRWFTPAAGNFLRLIPADVGRPIGNFNPGILGQDLELKIRNVIETLSVKETEVQDQTGRWHLLRIRPYKTSDNRIDGAVLVLVDIDDLRRSLALSRDLRAIIETVRECVVVLDADSVVKIANKYFYKIFQTTEALTVGRVIYSVAEGRLDLPGVRSLLDGAYHQGTRWQNYKIEVEQADKQRISVFMNASRLPDTDMMLLVGRDFGR
ncbi:MAG: PAS domain-containing protein [Ignavibacteriales bacterium]|nr:PAS domain-containing protein [Ignavibacteriales bacterium]